jgi:hypothetical protein
MAHARMTPRNPRSGWVKPGLLVLLVGTLTTTYSLIGAANNALPAILKMLDVPDCWRSANVYRGTQTDFRKEGDVWREYTSGAAAYIYEFDELNRTREEIILRNRTPRDTLADPASLVVYLPVCGGMAKLTEGTPPERSIDFEKVWKAPRGR